MVPRALPRPSPGQAPSAAARKEKIRSHPGTWMCKERERERGKNNGEGGRAGGGEDERSEDFGDATSPEHETLHSSGV